jgi:O-methyltransferase
MPNQSEVVREMYIDLLQKIIINEIYQDPPILTNRAIKRAAAGGYQPGLFEENNRQLGLDWPSVAHSMIGRKRMENLRFCVGKVLEQKIQGDLIETGVWRGGACILMRGILKAWGDNSRKVWVADSFSGLPAPNAAKYPADANDRHHKVEELSISLDQVKSNFTTYGLLDDQVQFLKGWFKDTLPVAPIEKLSLIRLDGDMYESTMDGLRNLYHKLSVGGFLIVDDYHAVAGCKAAVHDFFSTLDQDGLTEIVEIDGSGVFWQKRA